MTESMEVEIHGPFSWLTGLDHACVFESPVANLSGVYLWSVPYEGAEMVYYVGETGRSFRDRLKEHLVSYLAGLYRVWEPDLFARGEKRLVWDGMWGRGEEVRMGDFLARHTELAPRIHQIVRLLRFHLAPIEIDNRIRQRIEAAIVSALREQGGITGRFQDDDIRYRPRTSDEQVILVRIRSHSRILGLPEEVLA